VSKDTGIAARRKAVGVITGNDSLSEEMSEKREPPLPGKNPHNEKIWVKCAKRVKTTMKRKTRTRKKKRHRDRLEEVVLEGSSNVASRKCNQEEEGKEEQGN